jgi:hypothetical protein
MKVLKAMLAAAMSRSPMMNCRYVILWCSLKKRMWLGCIISIPPRLNYCMSRHKPPLKSFPYIATAPIAICPSRFTSHTTATHPTSHFPLHKPSSRQPTLLHHCTPHTQPFATLTLCFTQISCPLRNAPPAIYPTPHTHTATALQRFAL